MFVKPFRLSCFFIFITGIVIEDVEENEINVDNRIVGGQVINIKKAPYQVLIINEKDCSKRGICAGSIISSEWMLTTAHCTISAKSQDHMKIFSGLSIWGDSEGYMHSPEQILRHENYVPRIKLYDIAVIKVTPKFQFGETVKAIRLSSTVPPDKSPALTSGYGTDRVGGRCTGELRQVEIMVMNRQMCNKGYVQEINEQHICGGIPGGGKGSCTGDSGGPLVYKKDMTLIGVIMSGSLDNCTNKEPPAVHASVPYFREWIRGKSGI